jgi:uncharacterized protein YndB with AHSA1/START domain
MTPDPALDLVLERTLDLTPAEIWKAWTTPELLKPWFCPKPWSVSDCEIDLRPGGVFATVMRSPEGQPFPNHGCFLEVVPERRLTWTDALGAGFRPSPYDPHLPFRFTAMLELEPRGAGTLYRATAMHPDEEARKKHEAMGFQQGWGIVADQLVAFTKARR